MPAWAISTIVHVVLLLAMALVVSRPPRVETPRVILAAASQPDEDFGELEADPPDLETPEESIEIGSPLEVGDPVASPDMTVADPVAVAAPAAEADPEPLEVEPGDFAGQMPVASDLLADLGGAAGTPGMAGGFGGRSESGRLAATAGGGKDTEAAVDRALDWFLRHQLPDGGWSFDLESCPSCRGSCTHSGRSRAADRCAATGLALLPFLGRGYTHRVGPYRAQVERGIAFLADLVVKGNGQAYRRGGSMYSQGVATIALCECYAMSRDGSLAPVAQAALDFIMRAQDPVGGGWRYEPGEPGSSTATGWQIMALKSGGMAALRVDPRTLRRAGEFLDSVEVDGGARYGYLDDSRPRPGRSAVCLLSRMYLGRGKDHAGLQEGVAYLAKGGPSRDLYHDYYATQVMHHMEGEAWRAWNADMKPLLLETQAQEGHERGSWFTGVDGGQAGPDTAGRLYLTSLATMILEVYYRHLPIYRGQSVTRDW